MKEMSRVDQLNSERGCVRFLTKASLAGTVLSASNAIYQRGDPASIIAAGFFGAVFVGSGLNQLELSRSLRRMENASRDKDSAC